MDSSFKNSSFKNSSPWRWAEEPPPHALPRPSPRSCAHTRAIMRTAVCAYLKIYSNSNYIQKVPGSTSQKIQFE